MDDIVRKIWINSKQWAMLKALALVRVWVGGRGSGKTRVIAHLIKIMVCGSRMLKLKPMTFVVNGQQYGAKIFLLGSTYEQIMTKFWPEIQDGLEQHGMKEYLSVLSPGHFVVCKKPPEWFSRPKKKPKRYDNVITFFNGFTIELMSFDRDNNRRGGSYDGMIMDEAALVDFDKYAKSIGSLVRGNVHDWSHPWRFFKFMFTSRAWLQRGKWVEQKMKQLAVDHPEYFYIESSAEDNRPVLGDKYFEDKQKEFSPLVYAIEIMNKAVEKIPDGFYEFLDEEIHIYEPQNDIDYQDQKWISKGEKDLNAALDIDVSFDFNAAFSSATIWQEHKPGSNDERTGCDPDQWELRLLRNFYVKYELVDVLVEKICRHYMNHPNKVVNVYGGADGHSKWAAMTEYTYYQRISTKFMEFGWSAFIKADVKYSDPEHKMKHTTINACLRENDPALPVIRMNQDSAKESFISMSQAPVKGDYKKDKKSETQKTDDGSFVTEQQYATHLSDTVDNYIYPKAKKAASGSGISNLAAAWHGG
jgi:hypothetical protein